MYNSSGRVMAEAPATCGDESNLLTYDPKQPKHINIFGSPHYKKLIADGIARVVHVSSCAFETPEFSPTVVRKQDKDLLISTNWAEMFAEMSGKICPHAPEEHPAPLPPKDDEGNWTTKAMRVWGEGFCTAAARATILVAPKGGKSLDVGASQTLLSLALQETRKYDGLIELGLPDVDDHTIAIVAAQPKPSSVPISADELTKLKSHPPPQTDSELEKHIHRSFWCGCDDAEINSLVNSGALVEEDYESWRKANKTMPLWNVKMVRTFKISEKTGEALGRSRTCCVGTGHEQGSEYDYSSTPTPLFMTVLTLISAATVANDVDFHFDMSQFFQSIKCDAPNGPLAVNPPKRFRTNSDGRRVIFRTVNWLQGSKGASRAARAELVRVLQNIGCHAAVEDPSLFVLARGEQVLRFALHGDDGIGSSNCESLIDELKACLRSRWPTIKFGKWGDLLGYKCTRYRDVHVTELTAAKQIRKLATFVEGDVVLTPSVPFTEATRELANLLPVFGPCTVEELEEAEKQITWMQQVCGVMNYVAKLRFEIQCPLNVVQRHAHTSEKRVIPCTKIIIFYLLATADEPWRVEAGAQSTAADLTMAAPLPSDYEFDMDKEKPLYPFNVCDANLGERGSQMGIANMVGGVQVGGGSTRQHAVVTFSMTAEAFAATSTVASGVLARDLMHCMGYPQLLPAPLFVDNTATVDVGNQDAAMKRSQFIRRRIYMLIQTVFEGQIALFPVAGKKNPMDAQTKIVPRQQWMKMRQFILNWREKAKAVLYQKGKPSIEISTTEEQDIAAVQAGKAEFVPSGEGLVVYR